MYMKDEKIVEIDDYRLELENRIRNLLWTISGDYNVKYESRRFPVSALKKQSLCMTASSRALWQNIMTGICWVYICSKKKFSARQEREN